MFLVMEMNDLTASYVKKIPIMWDNKKGFLPPTQLYSYNQEKRPKIKMVGEFI